VKVVATSISDYLATFPSEFMMADAYTFTLIDGTVLRWTSAQADFTLGGNVWSAAGPIIVRSQARSVVGVEVDTLDLQMSASTLLLVNGVPFLAALRGGMFDGASVLLNRIFFTAPGVPVNATGVGDVILFLGDIGDIEAGRTSATVRVNSLLQRLQTQLPRNFYQPGCINTVYDAQCALVKATWEVTGVIVAASTASTLSVALGNAKGWFDQGIVRFTSGPNAGLTRTVRAYMLGSISVMSPFPYVPGLGDAFTARPGCDKSQNTCKVKFSNLAHFRGQPYIPSITSVVNV